MYAQIAARLGEIAGGLSKIDDFGKKLPNVINNAGQKGVRMMNDKIGGLANDAVKAAMKKFGL